jgi:hypothetical protein
MQTYNEITSSRFPLKAGVSALRDERALLWDEREQCKQARNEIINKVMFGK